MDICEIAPGLYIASRFYPVDDGWPALGVALDCSMGLHDDGREQGAQISELVIAAEALLRHVPIVVLVCDAGRNRSAVVAAGVLISQGLRPDEAIAVVRTARSRALDRTGGALTNETFLRYLRGSDHASSPRPVS